MKTEKHTHYTLGSTHSHLCSAESRVQAIYVNTGIEARILKADDSELYRVHIPTEQYSSYTEFIQAYVIDR